MTAASQNAFLNPRWPLLLRMHCKSNMAANIKIQHFRHFCPLGGATRGCDEHTLTLLTLILRRCTKNKAKEGGKLDENAAQTRLARSQFRPLQFCLLALPTLIIDKLSLPCSFSCRLSQEKPLKVS